MRGDDLHPSLVFWQAFRRVLIEGGPAIVFFAVFSWQGIMAGTAAFMAAAALSTAVSLRLNGGIPAAPLVTAGIVAGLGGATLLFGEETFIKLQPTVINGLFATTIAVARLSGYDLLRSALSPVLRLTDAGWTRLTWRLVTYFLVLAIANEAVWRGASTASWVSYKTAVMVCFNPLFMIAQLPLIRAHWSRGEVSGKPAAAKPARAAPAS